MTERTSWDRDAALQSVDGDCELLVEMAGLFLQDSAMLLDDIGQAIQAGDAAGLHRSAHTLKGSVANFAAEEAYQTALQLEQIGKSGDLTAAPSRYAALVEAIHRVDAGLAEFAGAALVAH